MPVVWSALWRNRVESVLTLLALSVAFALFSVMIAINAAYERAIYDTRIDRLIVTFLTRTAAARRNARIGDTMTMNAGPGSGTNGSGTWFFTVLGFIADPTGWGQQWSPDMIVGNLRYFQNSGNPDERGLVNFLRVAVDRPEHAHAVCREIEAWFTNATPALLCVPARENAEQLMDANINMRQISLGIGAAGLFMILFLTLHFLFYVGIAWLLRLGFRKLIRLHA